MRLTVLGGRGAWPDAGQACSGYLVECEGFRLLIDPGYAIVPRLVAKISAADVDAVYVTHGHPDHCADLNPLLRARALVEENPAPPLPVYAPTGSLTAVLALDRPGMLDPAYILHELTPGDGFRIGPFTAETLLLPHSRPNAGIRLTAGGRTMAYTGDTGPTPDLVTLARDADVFLCEASYPYEVPEDARTSLFTALGAGRVAADAGVGRLLLTHLMPGTDEDAALCAATDGFAGPITIATAGVTIAAS